MSEASDAEQAGDSAAQIMAGGAFDAENYSQSWERASPIFVPPPRAKQWISRRICPQTLGGLLSSQISIGRGK